MESGEIIFKAHLYRNQPLSTSEVGTFRFEGVNTTDKEIKVVKSTTSCGCTTVTYPKRIQPGETFYVVVTIDKKGMKVGSNYNQSVHIYYDNGEDYKLRINGTITE